MAEDRGRLHIVSLGGDEIAQLAISGSLTLSAKRLVAIDTSTANVADERARCAQLAVNFFLDAGADEAQALAQPLVVKILRPSPQADAS